MTEGIRRLHSTNCPARLRRGRCDCGAGYEASVFSVRDGKKIRKTFPTLAAAKAGGPMRSADSDAERCSPRVGRQSETRAMSFSQGCALA
jgi:hypothetical protein